MFSAYFDASGKHKADPAVTIAGFVATVDRWDKFSVAWKAILNTWGVDYFHMSEFVSYKGQYEFFTKDSEKRKEFINLLSDCIRKHIKKAFSITVITEAWREANAAHLLREQWGHPYSMAGAYCISSVVTWKKRRRFDAPIKYFIEDGDTGDKGELMEVARRRFGIRVYPDDSSLPPFQAADLLAWKRRTLITTVARLYKNGGGSKSLTEGLAALASAKKSVQAVSFDGIYKTIDSPQMVKICQKIPAR